MTRLKNWWNYLLSNSGEVSLKRVATILSLVFFFIAAWYIMRTDKVVPNQALFSKILDHLHDIILAGIAAILGDNFAQVLIARAKVNAAATILAPQPIIVPQQPTPASPGNPPIPVLSELHQVGAPNPEPPILDDMELRQIRRDLINSLKPE